MYISQCCINKTNVAEKLNLKQNLLFNFNLKEETGPYSINPDPLTLYFLVCLFFRKGIISVIKREQGLIFPRYMYFDRSWIADKISDEQSLNVRKLCLFYIFS